MKTVKQFVSVLSVPLSLAAGAVICLTIANGWNLDYAIAGTLLFTLTYLFLLEKVIPLKTHWGGTHNETRSDATNFGVKSSFDYYKPPNSSYFR